MHVTHRAREEVVSAANLDSDPHHCPGHDPARLSPTANRSRAFCLSGHEQPLCRVKSPSRLQRFSAITLRQVGTCHEALELKEADSGTAGELGAQPGPAPAARSEGVSSVRTQPGDGFRRHPCHCPSLSARWRAACLARAGRKPCRPPACPHMVTI